MLLEEIIIYGIVLLTCAVVIYLYLRSLKKASRKVAAKINKAKEEGLHEPVSLHPVINKSTCIKSGACIAACPEKDILGIVNGRAELINASHCVGHGACFHACPVEAISLVIGTEKRGVDLPHVNANFETNVPGMYIAGELGGMGLIKNSVEQGQQAVDSMVKAGIKKGGDALDLVIVGAGPAGISASLTAKKHNLNFLTLEQDSLGGTVFTFPRSKVVMTAPMNLPLHGKVKLFDTNKKQLLDLWNEVLSKNQINIQEHTKVEEIGRENGHFVLRTNREETIKSKNVLLAIGRRGTPRKLGVPGELSEKVAYRLLEPEMISGKKILVVGGGDSAVESAMLLMEQNEVTLSYRKDAFARIKPKNRDNIQAAIESNALNMQFNTNLTNIDTHQVSLQGNDGTEQVLDNDLVYIFAGGELPTQFLQKAGIEITKRFGYTVKKH
ncbi:MAG: 4Fe-4S dicluster domain-containing protein [Bacteroidetes bacterium]|nr:MAG: 4Fe-4S dicluster domain-containing protein [Bacteroidota bacterium]